MLNRKLLKDTENKMKIIFAGCSHTSGAEIEEPWHPGSPDKAYGRHLADKLSAEYETIAGPGWSNRWIYSKLYERLETIPENERQDYRVVVGWTAPNRIPIWHPERNKPYHMCPHLLRYDDNNIKKWHEMIYKTAMPTNEAKNYEHALVVGMQNTLKQLGIKYLFHWAIIPVIPTQQSQNLIDHSRFFEYHTLENSYWKTYEREHYTGGDRWKNHAPEDYHKIFADRIYKYITDGNLF